MRTTAIRGAALACAWMFLQGPVQGQAARDPAGAEKLFA